MRRQSKILIITLSAVSILFLGFTIDGNQDPQDQPGTKTVVIKYWYGGAAGYMWDIYGDINLVAEQNQDISAANTETERDSRMYASVNYYTKKGGQITHFKIVEGTEGKIVISFP